MYRDNNGNEIEEEAVAAFAEETDQNGKPQRFKQRHSMHSDTWLDR